VIAARCRISSLVCSKRNRAPATTKICDALAAASAFSSNPIRGSLQRQSAEQVRGISPEVHASYRLRIVRRSVTSAARLVSFGSMPPASYRSRPGY
jgi:hypothetical protein